MAFAGAVWRTVRFLRVLPELTAGGEVAWSGYMSVMALASIEHRGFLPATSASIGAALLPSVSGASGISSSA
jgi:hypothetical protein